MNQGRYFAAPPHSDVYSAALAPGRNQGFVDRAEDLMIEEIPPTLLVRPIRNVDTSISTSAYSVNDVTLHPNSSAPYATFSNKTVPRHHSLTPDTSAGFGLSLRKSSLQPTPNTALSRMQYSRLDNCSSETSINSPSTHALTNRKAQSHDNMYESTTTMTSDVLSVDNSLYSLNEETTRTSEARYQDQYHYNKAQSLDSMHTIDSGISGHDTSNGDYLYAKVNRNRQNTTANQSSRNNTDVEMTDWLSRQQKDEELSHDVYTVTCTAELKNDGMTREQTNVESFQNISFDDTIKEFENFAIDDSLTETVVAMVTEGNHEHETDRAENSLIRHSPDTFTKSTTYKRSEQTVIGSPSQEVCETSFTVAYDNSHHGNIERKTQHVGDTTNAVTTHTWMKTVQETSKVNQSVDIDINSWTMEQTEPKPEISASSMFTGPDLEAELNDSMKELLTGISMDTEKWTSLNQSATGESTSTYQVPRE